MHTRVYFYCVPTEGPGPVAYQHLVVCLAEGLRALGVSCYANVNYWPLDTSRTRFLLEHNPEVVPGDCDIVIISDDWFTWGGRPMPEGLFRADRRYVTVALDRQDGTRLITLQPEFRDFDLVLRTHYNESTRYPGNFRPWAYGLSERIIEATKDAWPTAERRNVLLANWRHSQNPHSVRLAVERTFLPRIASVLPVDSSHEALDEPPQSSYERVLWRETGRRHWHDYYRRLRESAACACFGGFFITRRPANKAGTISRGLRRIVTSTGMQTTLVSQFDSWRLWESFAAGCATFHVDLERYGCILPERPRNGIHYAGINLQKIDTTLAMLTDDPFFLIRIADAGRTWALEHYSPRASAARLLTLLKV